MLNETEMKPASGSMMEPMSQENKRKRTGVQITAVFIGILVCAFCANFGPLQKAHSICQHQLRTLSLHGDREPVHVALSAGTSSAKIGPLLEGDELEKTDEKGSLTQVYGRPKTIQREPMENDGPSDRTNTGTFLDNNSEKDISHLTKVKRKQEKQSVMKGAMPEEARFFQYDQNEFGGQTKRRNRRGKRKRGNRYKNRSGSDRYRKGNNRSWKNKRNMWGENNKRDSKKWGNNNKKGKNKWRGADRGGKKSSGKRNGGRTSRGGRRRGGRSRSKIFENGGFHGAGGEGVNTFFSANRKNPMFCNCKKQEFGDGECYFFTESDQYYCARRLCRPKYVCVERSASSVTCVLRELTRRIVPTSLNTCKTEKISDFMYVPYTFSKS